MQVAVEGAENQRSGRVSGSEVLDYSSSNGGNIACSRMPARGLLVFIVGSFGFAVLASAIAHIHVSLVMYYADLLQTVTIVCAMVVPLCLFGVLFQVVKPRGALARMLSAAAVAASSACVAFWHDIWEILR